MTGRRDWGGPLELAVVGLLTLGAVVLTAVGPLLGVVLLWFSARWTTTQKLVASVVVVGTVAATTGAVMLYPSLVGYGMNPWAMIAPLLLLAMVAPLPPLVTGVVLALRMQEEPGLAVP